MQVWSRVLVTDLRQHCSCLLIIGNIWLPHLLANSAAVVLRHPPVKGPRHAASRVVRPIPYHQRKPCSTPSFILAQLSRLNASSHCTIAASKQGRNCVQDMAQAAKALAW